MKGIGSPVKSLCQHALDLEQWQSIFSTTKARDRELAFLEANKVIDRVKKMISYITSSQKHLENVESLLSLG